MPNEITLPVGIARFVIIHYHIFKNAGSTVEHILNRVFGDKCVSVHGQHPDAVLAAEVLSEYLLQNPGVAAITSHHVRYPKPVIPNTVVFDICFLRDPLARFLSFYKHMRRSGGPDALSQLARSREPTEFFECLIEEYPAIVDNPQVVTLASGGQYTRPPDRTDLATACEIVRTMALPGNVEIFDESLVAAEYFLGSAFPKLQLHYVKQNVAPADSFSLPDFRARLGAKVLAKLQNLNQLDYELVAACTEEVRRRYNLVPDLPARFADFMKRC